MIRKKCAGSRCNRILQNSYEVWCSDYCKQRHESNQWILKPEEYGTVEHGEQLRAQSARNREIVIVKNTEENIEKKSTKEKEKDIQRVTMRDPEERTEKIITRTENDIFKSEMSGESTTGREIMLTKESDISDLKALSCQKSLDVDTLGTQQLDSKNYSTVLKGEIHQSVSELNDSARFLIACAKNHVQPQKVDDDGVVLKHASSYQTDVAIKSLSECRNILKTKLEYLKFYKEINR